MINKIVVNFFGAPSSGKTVAATSLFSKLKKLHVDVGLVSEFARHAVIEKNEMALKDQFFIWANQAHHIFCSYQHYQVVVTDSPILLGVVYNANGSEALHQLMFEQHGLYNNLNLMMQIDTTYPYSMTGRIHSLTESITIEHQISQMLETRDIPHLYHSEIEEEEIASLILSSIGATNDNP